METLEQILDLIHKEYLTLYPAKKDDECQCPSHKYFFLDLSEFLMCKNCFEIEIKSYDKNCYMFNIFQTEISNIILKNNQTFDVYKLSLFNKINEFNKKYENENKIKISKCECQNFNYTKKIKLKKSDNPYLIINITWADKYPNMLEILKIYCLIPMVDKYNNLFNLEEEDTNKIFYIKSIILYGIFHYIYVIYLNKQKRWGIVDDKTIKYIDKYNDLIDYLLRNHLMPVGLIYSQNKGDIIEGKETNINILSNDEYKKLYKFCEEVENRREELNISNIISKKGSFNETNENYLENNLFYKSLLNLVNSSSDSENEECNKKKKNNNNNNTNDKNYIEESEKSIDIFDGRQFLGDFNKNNLKGGLILLSSFDEEENEKILENENKESKKDEKDEYIGIKYRRAEK
jgi:hypothetical protein